MVDFLVIGPFNATIYKEVFPLIKDCRVRIGSSRVDKFTDGTKFGNTIWFSTISDYYPPELELKKHYNEIDYDRFDNYDCININRTEDIPKDYPGMMGVPITFLEKWNPEQFELIGLPNIGIVPEGWKGMTEDFIKLYYEQGNTGCIEIGNKNGYFIKDGKAIIPYVRLLIKKKIS